MNGQPLPVLAWIIIGFLAVFILVINFGLITALKKKKPTNQKDTSKGVLDVFKDPWKSEEDQWKKLGENVKSFKKEKDDTNKG
jgi:hypothetical protein